MGSARLWALVVLLLAGCSRTVEPPGRAAARRACAESVRARLRLPDDVRLDSVVYGQRGKELTVWATVEESHLSDVLGKVPIECVTRSGKVVRLHT